MWSNHKTYAFVFSKHFIENLKSVDAIILMAFDIYNNLKLWFKFYAFWHNFINPIYWFLYHITINLNKTNFSWTRILRSLKCVAIFFKIIIFVFIATYKI